ncbi:MAG: RdgB/HAM1 family non-canonical purine NTP pyrophosphatase [Ancrocorticia sp.]|uniref:RdgB/HAM1 family non-canonical purine NTP pyrophosphatase n=1 Tax=Ancrocorticia sp. TaxID=2593684 RepID=UPI003F921034
MNSAERRPPRLVLATRNEHKVIELRNILQPLLPGLEPEAVAGAGAFDLPEPVEDEVTFAGNALIKARQIARETGILAIADDSGICVDAMGGAPGVFSARWSGHHGADAENLQLLLHQLGDVPDRYRGAEFRCAAALVQPDGREIVKEGVMRGMLLHEPHGAGGFGYDPIFMPDGLTVSSAEISPAEKDAISHRGKAFRALAPHIAEALGHRA